MDSTLLMSGATEVLFFAIAFMLLVYSLLLTKKCIKESRLPNMREAIVQLILLATSLLSLRYMAVSSPKNTPTGLPVSAPTTFRDPAEQIPIVTIEPLDGEDYNRRLQEENEAARRRFVESVPEQ